MPEPRPGRAWQVDGRGIWTFDGLLADLEPYVEALGKAPFTRTEVARPDTAAHRHWVNEIRLDTLVRQPLHALTEAAVRAALPARRYVPYRAYTNVAMYGDMLFSHVDCPPERGDVTALWYLCTEWDLEWGGETVFFDSSGDIAAAVRPRPGRLVVFDGAIQHVGRPPNRICYHPRYTLAVKFEPAPA